MAGFMNKIKKSIDKGVTTVSVKSSSLLEVTKIKGHISSLEGQKNSFIHHLGDIVYEMYINDSMNQDTIHNRCKEIEEIDQKIKERQLEVEKILSEEKEILGTPSVESIESTEGQIRCECGAILAADAKFCTKCGKKVEI